MDSLDIRKIRRLVERFRTAMDELQEKGLFDKENPFRSFPRGCCGDTSYLLAEYLRKKGIDTIYVWGNDYDQSHAWLVVKNEFVKKPSEQVIALPNNITSVYNSYSSGINNETIDVTCYKENDLINGLIIDITGDQFGENPIYIGYMDDFHKKYEFGGAHDFERLSDARLYRIYRMIIQHIS